MHADKNLPRNKYSTQRNGRTTTVVGFSSEQQYRTGFGPFTPGFKHVSHGDAEALRAAITPNTAGPGRPPTSLPRAPTKSRGWRAFAGHDVDG